jgi:hypothetical protein
MQRLVKTVLLWLLIATLPIQGIAAAAKAACGPEHHETMTMQEQESPLQHAMTHDHDGHQDMMMADADVAVGHASDNHHSHKSSFCSSCAACCVGAVAPPFAFNQTMPPSLSESVHISAAPLVAGVIPAGLERPPRQLSA